MKKYIFIILAASVLAGCVDQLNKFPLDRETDETFFSSETDLVAFSNSFYSLFPSPDERASVRSGMIAFDNADNIFSKTQSSEVRGNRTVPSSGNGWTFTKLRDINTMLDHIDRCKDPEVHAKYKALARFFRAYFYFDKIRIFGDVPWCGTQLWDNSPELYNPRDNREVVMQKIVEDLLFAIDSLPDKKSVYTVTKYTAQALLSRVALFEGTFRKYHDYQVPDSVANPHSANWYLGLCVSVSKDFIDEGKYTIYSTGNPDKDYLHLFTAEKYEGDPTADEVILAENFNSEYGRSHNVNNITIATSKDCPGMSRKAVASYLNADGTRFTDTADWEKKSFFEETQGRDPRLAQSIRTPGYKRIGRDNTEAPLFGSTVSGYQLIKHVQAPGDGDIKDKDGKSDADIIVFRAAEVYLNYAEAKAELGTISQNDLDISVNRIRARVNMPALEVSVPLDTFLTSAAWGGYTGTTNPLILELRRERCVELGQEGHRYFDLMRWKEGKILEKPMYGMYFPADTSGLYDLDRDGNFDVYLYSDQKDATKAGKAKYNYKLNAEIYLTGGDHGMVFPHKNSPGKWDEDKDYLYPIPYGEIQLNPNLAQNPGWTL
ncbi:MAG: RagB/SusD family nutrient uptake outer membrane protein [Bacteroidales bacterium]|nr:RagB/SusD family nutrient uptake outer membrane protein [Bacteroidales bacterium]